MTGLFQLPGVSHHCTSPEVRWVPPINCQGPEDIEELLNYGLELDITWDPAGSRGTSTVTYSISTPTSSPKGDRAPFFLAETWERTSKTDGMLLKGCKTAQGAGYEGEEGLSWDLCIPLSPSYLFLALPHCEQIQGAWEDQQAPAHCLTSHH